MGIPVIGGGILIGLPTHGPRSKAEGARLSTRTSQAEPSSGISYGDITLLPTYYSPKASVGRCSVRRCLAFYLPDAF